MWKRDYKPLIIVTSGDVAGVGPEVIIKTLTDERIRRRARIFVVGPASIFYEIAGKNLINIAEDVTEYQPSVINLIDTGNLKKVTFGKPDRDSAIMAIRALEKAVDILRKEENAALVTAPIYKKGIQDAGFSFPGHTEYLAEMFNCRVLMSFWGKKLKVATLTTHLPLKNVAENITESKLKQSLSIALDSLKLILNKEKPVVAVLGLNPHAGEEGKLGKEEMNIIEPVCEYYRGMGELVKGPLPADSAFFRALKGEFDMVFGMYHDQVLTPFKMLYFEEGVNVTLGLPFIRTSPDHGTAFDIAGKGIASEKSFRNALLMAIAYGRLQGRQALNRKKEG